MQKNQAKERLLSEKGLYYRNKRPVEVEAVFGQLKFNNKLTRFTLKRLEKRIVEMRLMVIAHTLWKLWTKIVDNLLFYKK